jgi:hypothetical protein
VDWIRLAHDRDQCGAVVNTVMSRLSDSIKKVGFFDKLSDY